MENPRHTKIPEQPYMEDIKVVYCSYCMYGFKYQKHTTLWHSDLIRLVLKFAIARVLTKLNSEATTVESQGADDFLEMT